MEFVYVLLGKAGGWYGELMEILKKRPPLPNFPAQAPQNISPQNVHWKSGTVFVSNARIEPVTGAMLTQSKHATNKY